MKFIHAADIHLDSLSTGLRDFYGMGTVSISEATQNTFRALIDLAIDQQVDFLVIAGDLFDSNWKDYSLGLFFIEQIERITCPIYYLRGNHDAENRLVKKLPYPKNLIEISAEKPQTYLLDSLKIAIHGQSYSTYHTREDLSLGYPKAIAGYFNIGLLHTSGDVKHGITPYSPYQTDKILEKGYQYWALGHLHDFQVLRQSPWIVYSGNIQGRHVNETGSKGCCIVSVDEDRESKVDFIPLSKLLWERLELDLSSLKSKKSLKEEILKKVEEGFSSKLSSGMEIILRITFVGTLHFDLDVDKDLEHLDHQVHCWLKEHYLGKVRLEKVEDFSKSFKSLDDFKKENPLIETLLASLEREFQDNDTQNYFQELVDKLKEKAPNEYKKNPFFMEFENPNSHEAFMNRVKDCIHRGLMRSSS